jgi:predicted TIM-barrel fold metal-dependent hydrolase
MADGRVLARDPEGNEYAVLDIHQHLPMDPSAWDGDLRARLAFMDRFGIAEACLLPPSLRNGVPAHTLNERVAEYRRRAPERFPVAMGTTELQAEPRVRLRQLRGLKELGLSGVVWHHMFEGEFMDWPATIEAVDFCASEGLQVVVHAIVGSLAEAPWRLGRICRRFSEVNVIALDALSSPHHGQAMIELASDHPNLVLDTSVLTSFGNLVERFVDANGPDRLVFGTDFEANPKSFSFPYPLAEVLHCELSVESKARILRGNLARILGLRGAYGQ